MPTKGFPDFIAPMMAKSVKEAVGFAGLDF